MKIAFTSRSWREWQKLSSKTQNHLQEKLILYANNPFKCAIKLSDPRIGQYRFRIGDYRIIFDIDRDKIIVIAVGHRRDIYK